MLTGTGERDRAVANLLGYIIAVGVFLTFTAATLAGGLTVYEDSQEHAQRTQIEHNSQVLALSIEEVDRLARASSVDERISKSVDLSDTLAGEGYRIRIVDSGGDTHLIFETDNEDVANRVPFAVTLDVEEKTFEGGPVLVVREAGTDEIKVIEVSDE